MIQMNSKVKLNKSSNRRANKSRVNFNLPLRKIKIKVNKNQYLSTMLFKNKIKNINK